MSPSVKWRFRVTALTIVTAKCQSIPPVDSSLAFGTGVAAKHLFSSPSKLNFNCKRLKDPHSCTFPPPRDNTVKGFSSEKMHWENHPLTHPLNWLRWKRKGLLKAAAYFIYIPVSAVSSFLRLRSTPSLTETWRAVGRLPNRGT